MRIIIALAVLAVFLSLGGCSRNNLAYAKPVSSTPLPYPTRAEAVEQEAEVKFKPAMVGFAEGKAQEGPKDIIAAQIRSQGYACNSPQSAERDVAASAANQAVWMLRCQNASYRVTLIPNLLPRSRKLAKRCARRCTKRPHPMTRTPARRQRPQTPNSFTVHGSSAAGSAAWRYCSPRAGLRPSSALWPCQHQPSSHVHKNVGERPSRHSRRGCARRPTAARSGEALHRLW